VPACWQRRHPRRRGPGPYSGSQGAQALAAAELFPAPPPGQHRFLRVGELQDLLLLRGIALAQHRMSGASQVAIYGTDGRAGGELEPLSTTLVKRAERELSEAIVRYLEQTVGARKAGPSRRNWTTSRHAW